MELQLTALDLADGILEYHSRIPWVQYFVLPSIKLIFTTPFLQQPFVAVWVWSLGVVPGEAGMVNYILGESKSKPEP